MSFSHSPRIVTDGLVLCLDAANPQSYPGSGTSWADLSGNGNNGTLTNGPTFNSGNSGSIVFDGVDDYVQLVDSPSYKVQFPITLAAWFNVQTLTNYGVILRNDNTSSFHWGVNIAVDSDYGISSAYGNGTVNNSPGRRTYKYTGPIDKDKWYYFVAVHFDNLNANGYLNGNQISMPYLSGDATNLAYGSEGGVIGFRFDVAGFGYFKGDIPIVQIYNRALSASEVLQNYEAVKSRFGL